MARLVLSQNDRILLHLYELERYRDEPEVPMTASQEGIAQKLDTQVFNASRALSLLEAEGLVLDRLAHVRGAPRRRRAYFLSDKGRAAAQSIRADIGKRKIVVEHAGKAQELTVEDATRKLGTALGRPVAFFEVVELARQFDSVLSSGLAGSEGAAPGLKEYVSWTQGRPKVETFFGRKAELSSMEENVTGSGVSAILLWGLPGIGKSTLASRLFDSLSGKRSQFWYSFREWDSESTFLAALIEFLSAAGRYSASLANKRGASRSELFLPLAGDFSGEDFVLFLDDIQKPTKDITYIVEIVVEAVKSSGRSKIVLISKSMPKFFSRTASGNTVLELTGLDRDSAWKLAQSLNAKDSIRLVNESHGHPLLLNLMARGGVAETKGDVVSFMEREVYSTISTEEKRVLETLSIYRHPVPLDALGNIDYRVVAALKERGLISEQQEGIWTHDLLREFILPRITSEDRLSLHRIVADYCAQRQGVEWNLETLHHLVEARDWAAACRTSIADVPQLEKDFPEETLALLSRIELGSIDPRSRAELLFFRGQLNESAGVHEAALADFQASLAILGETDSEKRALVYEMVARMQSQMDRWSESLSTHQNALRLYEKSGDREGQAREWINIGTGHRRRGEFGKSREAYDRALTLSSLAEDRLIQAACLNNIALLDRDEGNLGDAERRLRESMSLAHAVRDHIGEAFGLENLGDILKSEGRMSEAANVYLDSSEAYRRSGDVTESKRLVAASAEVYGMLGQHAKGVELCEEALARPELRKRKGLFQRSPRHDFGDVALASTLVELLRLSGDLKRAQKGLAEYYLVSDSIGDIALKAQGRLMLAVIHEDSGDLENAIRSLSEAEEMLRRAGNHEGLIAVYMRRGTVEEKQGDYDAAAEDYRNAARHAEQIRDKVSLSQALESLNAVGRPG